MTLNYAQAVSHAVFCVAKHDEEMGVEVQPNVLRLSDLLDELLAETERWLRRFFLATQDHEQTERTEARQRVELAAEALERKEKRLAEEAAGSVRPLRKEG